MKSLTTAVGAARLSFVFLLLVCVSGGVFISVVGGEDFVNTSVDRAVQCAVRVVKHTVTIRAKNTSNRSLSEYLLVFPDRNTTTPSRLQIRAPSGPIFSHETLPSTTTAKSFDSPLVNVRVNLPQRLAAGDSVSLVVSYYLGHAYTPLPKFKELSDPQLVFTSDNLYFPSPYKTENQTTVVTLPSSSPIVRLEPEAVSKRNDNVVVFGPFKNVDPLSRGDEMMLVHFRLLKHLAFFRKVVRHVYVSHWGAVTFHESFKLHNDAAGNKGEYSRVAMRNEAAESSTFYEGTAYLPRNVFGLYYFDSIGNVSSSNAKRDSVSDTPVTRLTLRPRFPVLGGWNSEFELQYSTPARTTIRVSNEDSRDHVLSIPSSSPFKTMFVDEMVTRVVLPRGSSNVRLNLPRDATTNWTETEWGWFDLRILNGRKVICWSEVNVYLTEAEVLGDKSVVMYSAPRYGQLQTAFVIFLYFFVPFLLYIAARRFSLRIATKREVAIETEMTAPMVEEKESK